jgi:hypothetical protein
MVEEQEMKKMAIVFQKEKQLIQIFMKKIFHTQSFLQVVRK